MRVTRHPRRDILSHLADRSRVLDCRFLLSLAFESRILLLRHVPACLRLLVPALGVVVALPAGLIGQIRVVSYNTLDGPTPGVHDNAANLHTIFSSIAGQQVNGIARRPAVIVLQEQTASSPTNLANLLNGIAGYGGTYVAAMPSGQPNDDRQAFLYDTSQVTLVSTATSIATGEVRPVIRAGFRPVGYTSTAANLWVYGAHLMASDPTGRANQTAAMRSNANILGAGAHAIFAGDFNMDSNQEQAWLNLVTGAGAGLAVDPLNPTNVPQTWNNNSAFAGIHTQSTRTGATPDNDGGATGGMDDRFDVQLSTQPLHDGEGLAYIPNSYRAFGNDGQHFNKAINATPTIPLGAAVANALWDASDHLPVVADYQLPAKMTVSQTATPPPRVIVGAATGATFRIQNTAPVTVSVAADELDYALSTTGAGTGAFAGSTLATTPGDLRSVQLDTSSAGVKTATVTVSSSSQGVEGGSASFGVSTEVLDRARPSFAASTVVTSLAIDLGIWAVGSEPPLPLPVAVHNVAGALPSAGLDVDAVAPGGDSATLSLTLATGGAPVPAGASRMGEVGLRTDAVGAFEATYLLLTSDEDLPGASALAPLALTLQARVALPGDATLDNAVNIADFSILASNFNTSGAGWQQGDFNRDGIVGIADFAALAANFNTTAPAPNRSVPEPHAAAVAVAAILACLPRRRRVATGPG